MICFYLQIYIVMIKYKCEGDEMNYVIKKGTKMKINTFVKPSSLRAVQHTLKPFVEKLAPSDIAKLLCFWLGAAYLDKWMNKAIDNGYQINASLGENGVTFDAKPYAAMCVSSEVTSSSHMEKVEAF